MRKSLINGVLLVLLLAGSARAQGVHCSTPTLDQSASAVGSIVVRSTTGNTYLCGVSVTWHSSSARWLMVFNATSLPGNGAVTPVYCANITPTAGAADGTLDFSWMLAPITTNSGMVIAVSTNAAGCSTLTVDGSNNRFDVQAITP